MPSRRLARIPAPDETPDPHASAADFRDTSRPQAADTRWLVVPGEASHQDFEEAVREGLLASQKSLPSQFFYDEEGSKLFEQICDLDEYYLTRAEAEILEAESDGLAAALPEIEALVELGSGSAIKTEYLIRAFEADDRHLAYLPIDVSRSALEESVDRLESRHPNLAIRPAVAEYEAGLDEIEAIGLGPKLTLWLGSSIGNLNRASATKFLRGLRNRMRDADRLLVGIDLRKDRETLERAYDDSEGVTARFDMNLLSRINRDLGGRFDLDRFRHRVHYDEDSGSVRSFLESQIDQSVEIDGLDLSVRFEAGERIHTEDSHKYSPREIDELARDAGLEVEKRFLDSLGRFSLNLLAGARATLSRAQTA